MSINVACFKVGLLAFPDAQKVRGILFVKCWPSGRLTGSCMHVVGHFEELSPGQRENKLRYHDSPGMSATCSSVLINRACRKMLVGSIRISVGSLEWLVGPCGSRCARKRKMAVALFARNYCRAAILTSPTSLLRLLSKLCSFFVSPRLLYFF